MIRNRLDKLERAAKALGGAQCRVCFGHMTAAMGVFYEHDPRGPGYRKTGEAIVLHDDARIDDQLCCRACGTPAVRFAVMLTPGMPVPEGRRIRIDTRSEV